MSHAEGTNTLTIELPQGVLAQLAPTPEDASRELLLAAAINCIARGGSRRVKAP
jgi:hypothetical protein